MMMGKKELVERYKEWDRRLREANRRKWEEKKRILKEGKWYFVAILTIAIIATIWVLFWLAGAGKI